MAKNSGSKDGKDPLNMKIRRKKKENYQRERVRGDEEIHFLEVLHYAWSSFCVGLN